MEACVFYSGKRYYCVQNERKDVNTNSCPWREVLNVWLLAKVNIMLLWSTVQRQDCLIGFFECTSTWFWKHDRVEVCFPFFYTRTQAFIKNWVQADFSTIAITWQRSERHYHILSRRLLGTSKCWAVPEVEANAKVTMVEKPTRRWVNFLISAHSV